MLTKHEVEDRLREELEISRKHLSQSLNLFLRIAGENTADSPRQLARVSADQSAARDKVVEAMCRLNQFFIFGTVPDDLKEKARAAEAF